MIMVLAFLGNPGKKFAASRHNYGWMAADMLQTRYPAMHWKTKFNSLVSEPVVIGGSRTVCIRPMQYMNRSGSGIAALAKFYSVSPGHVVVVHDNMELPFGKVAFRQGGGLHGHNGLRSIAAVLGTKDFPRIALGIGRPPSGRDPGGYVLGRFSELEEAQLHDCLIKSVEIIESLGRTGPGAMEPVTFGIFPR